MPGSTAGKADQKLTLIFRTGGAGQVPFGVSLVAAALAAAARVMALFGTSVVWSHKKGLVFT